MAASTRRASKFALARRVTAERRLQRRAAMAELDKAVKPAAPPPTSKPAATAPAVTAADTKASPPGGNAIAAKAPTVPIDLQGKSTFDPSPEVAEYIRLQKHAGAEIPVKFGNLAKAGGTIHVAATHGGKAFRTVDKGGLAAIPLDHSFFQPLSAIDPYLRIHIENSQITGWAAPKKTLGSINAIDKLLVQAGPALGLAGFDLGHPNFQNAIEAGVFKLGTKHDIDVTLGGWVHMKLGLGLENDIVRFSASGKVTVRGLAEVVLSLSRDDKGVVTGEADLAVTLAKFSGKATAKYINGDVSVLGTLSYATEKLRGSVTVVVMEAAEAEKAARAQIDPQNLITEETSDKEKKPERFKKGERGVAGWGELDFAFTDWFTGKAKAIFGPAGYITIIGKIAPPKSIELMHERVWNTNLFSVDILARYGLPYVADIHVGIGVSLGAVARVGPATLSDITVEGVYSTDPTVLNSFAISGAFRISAYAGLNLRFEGKAGLTILKHDINFGAALTGKAGVKGYAEARPTLGYREKADPVAGKKGEYFLKGHLEIAAQPFLGLDGELFVKLDSPWWSPAPDKTWTWPLFSLEYPLPGQFGVAADIDYVIGSDQFPDIKWGKADFDASKFTDSLMDDQIPPKKVGGDVAQAGTWKGEEPPPPTAPPAPAAGDKKAPGTAAPKAGSPAAKGGKGGGQTPDESAAVARTPDAARRFAEGMEALGKLHEQAERAPEDGDELHTNLDALKKRFGFTKLDADLEGDYWVIDAELNPRNRKSNKRQTIKAKKPAKPKDISADVASGSRTKPGDESWTHTPRWAKWVKRGGEVHEHPDGSITLKMGSLSCKYSPDGEPDFTPLLDDPWGIREVNVGKFVDRDTDFREANNRVGHPEWGKESPPGYTWHHKTTVPVLQCVRRDIHKLFRHAGGISAQT
jgi:hypothetical protein